jgi:hypothetical protein
VPLAAVSGRGCRRGREQAGRADEARERDLAEPCGAVPPAIVACTMPVSLIVSAVVFAGR